ncbi:MAG: hypothetical protein ACYDG5_01570 [Dehalococcoidales bacterium]
MVKLIKRKEDAPKSKRNPAVHGYYTRMLGEAEKRDFLKAAGIEGVDEEIALIRLEIKKAILGGDDSNLKTLIKATNALERLVRTKYQITTSQQKGLKEAIGNVIKDIAIPLGINVGSAIIEKKI